MQKLSGKQSFEFRLGDLFRKNNVTAVLRSWDENGDGSVSPLHLPLCLLLWPLCHLRSTAITIVDKLS